ncbi:carboxypeptidase-like regulatory domain-containing protein [Tenacibaculum halocynthiae]|uniref:carboxypeptidase-like regulatory domain-containing protein n=1 Tax=Tenacibaculum halocynthiae TaxID=1254437 RepID=UPI003D649B0C
MKNQFTLGINKPCSEDYNQFTPTNSGGFCGSCEKNVIDFTKMNSKEIISYFKNNDSKKTCGRFKKHQLKTYSETTYLHKKQSLIGVLALTIISLFIPNTANAQKCKQPTEIVIQKNKKLKLISPNNEVTIKGVVKDESGPLPGVSVLLKGTTIGTETDFDGNFEFPKQLKKGDVLIFSFVGMKTEEVTITNKIIASKKLIQLKMNNDNILGEIVFVGEVAIKKTYSSKRK